METEGNGSNEIKRFCVDCKTTKTPLWRGGPAGPKSLCNACGIRQRKGKRVRIGIHNGVKKEIIKNRLDCSFRLKLLSSDIGGSLQRLLVSEQQRKWAEEEEAAALLVALSCGLFLKKQSC